jgi:hypothetical protein
MRQLVAIAALVVLVTIGASEAHAQSGGDELPKETFVYTVKTLPVTPGATFTLDGETRVAGSDGVVRFTVPVEDSGAPGRGVFDRVVLETPEVELAPDTRAVFARWRGRLSEASTITAQFKFEYLVQFALEDGSGAPVPPERIDEITLKSSIGEIRIIDPTEAPWLLGTRIVPGRATLDEKPVFWTVQSATDSGSPVVNRSETKFFPATERDIVMRTLYFSARFEVVDAFFGFRTGGALLIESPNGSVDRVPLTDGVVEFDQLARGEYIVTVEGPGMKLSQPVAISRDQDIDLKLYTWLDLGLVALAGLAFLTVPLLLGTRARRKRRRQTEFEERLQQLVSGGHANGSGGEASVGPPDRGESTS